MTSDGLGRRFWTLWAGFTATNLGDGLTLVAFPLLAFDLSGGDARLVALVSVFRFLPFVLIGLPAGVILDRFDRRSLAVAAQIARGAVLAAMALVVVLDAATITIVVAAAFVVGVGELMTDGGLPALVRYLVSTDQLELANSRLSATQTVTNLFIGPPLGALLFTVEPAFPLAVAAGLYLGAALILTQLPGHYRPPTPTEGGRFLDQIGVGLRYVWGHEVLRPLALTVAVFSFFGEAVNSVLVILAKERLGLSSFEYSLLLTVDAIASVTMSFFVARLVARFGHSASMQVSVVTFALGALLFGSTTMIAGVVLASLLGGVSDPTWNVVSSTIRQRLVPDEIFGRMMTAYLFVAWSIQPLGALVGGLIAEQWGPQWVYLMSGTAVGSLLVLGRPLFRAVERSVTRL